MLYKIKILLFPILFLSSLSAFELEAQVNFYATTDAREVLSGSYFEVQFVMENASGSEFIPPAFEGFQLVSGPSQSNQISIINGKRTQRKSFAYTFLARKPGNFEIGSATIKIGGKSYTSKALSIQVVKGRGKSSNGEKRQDVFVKMELSDTLVYPGQQVLLKYVLYTKRRVSSYNLLSNPSFEGFYTQDINTSKQTQRRVIDGVEYQSQALHTVALFPQTIGELYLEPVQFSLGLAVRNNPFSFFNRSEQLPVITNDAWVRSIPLPGEAPANFNGAIGKYSLAASISNQEISTDDAVALKVTVQGNGLAKFIEAPVLDLQNRFDVYDPSVIDEAVYATNDDVISRKTFEYLMVPLKEGHQKFNIQFSYFDTDSSKYITLESQAIRLIVSAGKNQLSGLSSVEILQKYRLRPMMLEGNTSIAGAYFFGSNLFYVLFSLLIGIIPFILVIKWYLLRKGKIDPELIKQKRAAKEAAKRLSKAQSLLENNEHKAFYKSITETFQKYISDKYAVDTVDMNKESIKTKLEIKGLSAQLISEYMDLLILCEKALFSGINQEGDLSIYQRADLLLKEMLLFLEKKP